MNDRWLPPRAAALGLLIGVVVFLTLHLVLDASVLGSLVWLLAGGAIGTALVLHVRRVELLRTRQAQGYFVSAMMVAGITLAWLPPGTVGEALQTGTGSTSIDSAERERSAVWRGLFPEASSAVQDLLDAAQADYPLSETTIQSIYVTSSSVLLTVFDPTADLVRGYAMDRNGQIYDPSVSNVDPTAINEFALSAVQVEDLNALFDEVVTAYQVPPSADDVLSVSASGKGAAPVITLGLGPADQRTEVFADASGAIQDAPG